MPRGRPPTFDKDAALEEAMVVFWRQGFEGASVQTLTEAMGIRHPTSFYKAYGDKGNLFRLAVERYADTVGAAPIAALRSGASLDDAVAGMLAAGVELYSETSGGAGCLIVSGAVNCTPDNADIATFLTAYRRMIQAALAERFAQAVESGEIDTRSDVAALAEFYAALLHGIAVRARDGAPAATLRATVRLAPGVRDLCRRHLAPANSTVTGPQSTAPSEESQ